MAQEVTKLDKDAQMAVAPLTPMQVLQTLVERGADPDAIMKMMDAQERWEAGNARKEYVAAMARFREMAPTIDQTRSGHNIKYAGLAETLEQIRGILSECGLSHSWKTEQDGDRITVTCCVTHIGGHQECTTMSAAPDTSGSKNSIQAIGSTITYLERYTLFAILGLASKEQDTDAALPAETITAAEAAHLETVAQEVGANIPAFLKWFKAASFQAIPANRYDAALAALEKKRGQ